MNDNLRFGRKEKMEELRLEIVDVQEKRKIYNWLANSDVTSQMFDEENPPETWEEFDENEKDFLFNNNAPDKGCYLKIIKAEEEIGVISYACFHLKEGTAELDIWLKEKKYCGKGYGTEAIKMLTQRLYEEYGINQFVIRPSIKNIPAIKSYKKSGFIVEEIDPAEYLKEEYIEEYAEGDYGKQGTLTLIRRM